ncbi:hypothetical protein BJ165DRAFT_1425854 [Panaeolus papilionaceus]|nr:hypothetical protein BJ165DRAFT_1425854 [Panaeolus papilionaceus]
MPLPRRATHRPRPQTVTQPQPQLAQPQLDRIMESNIANLKKLTDQFRPVPEPIRSSYLYLVNAVVCPLEPTACPGTMFFALTPTMILIEKPGFQGSGVSKLHGFWSILYNFLVAERTDQQFASMVRKFSAPCACNVENRRWVMSPHLHNQVKEWTEIEASKLSGKNPGLSLNGRSHAWRFIKLLCGLLRAMLSVAKEASVTKGVSRRWPADTSELLLLGPDQVVKSLLQWNRFVGDFFAIEFIPALIKVCGPLIYDSVARLDAITILALDPIKAQIHKILRVLEDELAQEIPLEDSQLKDYEFTKLANYLRECLREVFRPPIKASVRMLNAASATKALQLCSIFCYLIPLLQIRSSCDPGYLEFLGTHLAHFGSQTFCHFNLHLLDRPNILLHPSVVEATEKNYQGKLTMESSVCYDVGVPSYEHIASAMVECRATRACSGPGCDLSFKEKASSYKTCAGCSTVGYCSRECQLRHWKADADDSHKRDCKLLAKILTERGGWKESTNREGRLYGELQELAVVIEKMQEDGKLSDEEFRWITRWATLSAAGWHNSVYLTLEWHPGYDDYDEILSRLLELEGSKPACVNRIICAMAKGEHLGTPGELRARGLLDHTNMTWLDT